MAHDVIMPALGMAQETGLILAWRKSPGDPVKTGEVLMEVETDKAAMEVEALADGYLTEIRAGEGVEVPVGEVIAVISESTGDVKPIPDTKTEAPKPLVEKKAEEQKPVEQPDSKVAKKEHKADVEAAKSGKTPLKAAASATSAAPAGAAMAGGLSKAQVLALYEEGTYELVPADGMRKTIAARLTESKQTVPHFYLTVDCKIDALLAAREQINATAPKNKDGKPEFKLSVNDFVMKAWAIALQRVPTANATWAGDSILYHKRSDVAVAVAIPGGLFTPVVKSCDTKSLREISEAVKDLATRARNKKLMPHEYQGGASSVSNLGMFGIKDFAAVINPPHGTILAVGVGEERVYPDKGEIKIGQFMTCTLSCDHRVVDGATSVQFLVKIKQLLEDPETLLLEG